MFNNIYNNKRVLITGHTGFKGSWLALWLTQMGAKVTGYSLNPPTQPSHFDLLKLGINSIIGDIRDKQSLALAFQNAQPEIVFHLAAQPIVRQSYKDAVATFETNVMGTINVFEAARKTDIVRAIVNVTSDKCYQNNEQLQGYTETDPVGGHDPYSASKGCSELVTSSWRNSFFNLKDFGRTHQVLLASARAGNVIGGGDWAVDRLIPDIMRSTQKNEQAVIRNPQATRPWQHVLEPLSGYLLLGQKLLEGKKEFAEAWNFGPSDDGNMTVGDVVKKVQVAWPKVQYAIQQDPTQPHEAGLLKLDCAKAHTRMQWLPVWDGSTAIKKTVEWYKAFYGSKDVHSQADLQSYIADAKKQNLKWADA